mmetsp:Transcript_25828/g.75549  ORF Transcript_25828/g.75549 Transcript_25828/m.75549 type:complete len:122 (-) Transcript_25828:199-564(-)
MAASDAIMDIRNMLKHLFLMSGERSEEKALDRSRHARVTARPPTQHASPQCAHGCGARRAGSEPPIQSRQHAAHRAVVYSRRIGTLLVRLFLNSLSNSLGSSSAFAQPRAPGLTSTPGRPP